MTGQSERPQDKLKDIGPVSRLLGAKWIRRDDRVAILRVPRWLPKSVVQKVGEQLQADYRFAWPDAEPNLTTEGHMIRIEWSPRHPVPGSLPKLPQSIFNLETDRRRR